MRKTLQAAGGILLLALCMIVARPWWPGDAEAGAGPVLEGPVDSSRAVPSSRAAFQPRRPALERASDPTPEAAGQRREDILAEITAASITYDAAQLSVIRPYLLDPDPEVRTAAIHGMIVLGDAAAGPMLRDAAAIAATPHDAVELLDAAAYVELPPAKLRRTGPRKPDSESSRHERQSRDGTSPLPGARPE